MGKGERRDSIGLDRALEMQRVWAEIGTPEDLSCLIDKSREFQFQLDVTARIGSLESAPKKVRVYVFDAALLIAAENPNAGSMEPQEAPKYWFADHPSSGNEDLDDSFESAEPKKKDSEIKPQGPFKLILYADLLQTFPCVFRLDRLKATCMLLTNVQRCGIEGETVRVNRVEIWLTDDEASEEVQKVVCGLPQSNMQNLYQPRNFAKVIKKPGGRGTVLEEGKKQRKKKETQKRYESIQQQKTGGRTRKRSSMPTDLKRGKLFSEPRTSRDTKSIRDKLKKQGKKRQEEILLKKELMGDGENPFADYTVIFGCKQMGFKLIDTRLEKEGGFTIEAIEHHGLAEAAGIVVGDSLVSINGQSTRKMKNLEVVLESLTEEDVTKVILARSKVAHENMKATKGARRSTNYSTATGENRRAKSSVVQMNEEDMIPLRFIDVDESEVVSEILYDVRSKPRNNKVVLPHFQDLCDTDYEDSDEEPVDEELDRIIGQASLIKSRVLAGKGKSSQDSKRLQILARMRRGVNYEISYLLQKLQRDQSRKDYEEEAQVDELFELLLASTENKKRRGCVHNLREIYRGELSYLKELDVLLNGKITIAEIRRPFKCKESKGPFCEHNWPKKLCKSESAKTAQAVSPKDLDAVFLNVQSLINIHQRIAGTLREGMVHLLARLNKKKEKSKSNEVDLQSGIGLLLALFLDEYGSITPFFAMYTQYLSRYNEATIRHRQVQEVNQWYKEGIQDLEKVAGQGFTALIYKPVQKLTKYPLLFQSLTSHVMVYLADRTGKPVKSAEDAFMAAASCTDDDPKLKKELTSFATMVASLNGAATVLHATVDKVNAKVGDALALKDMHQACLEIDTVDKLQDLMQPSRKLKLKIELGKFEVEATYPEEHASAYLYVFNDLVVVGVPKVALDRKLSVSSVTTSTLKRVKSMFGSKTNTEPKKKKKSLMKKTMERKERSMFKSNKSKRKSSGPSGKKIFSSMRDRASSIVSTLSMKGRQKRKKLLDPAQFWNIEQLTNPEKQMGSIEVDEVDEDDEPTGATKEVEMFVLQYIVAADENNDWEQKPRFFFESPKDRDEVIKVIEQMQLESAEKKKAFQDFKQTVLEEQQRRSAARASKQI